MLIEFEVRNFLSIRDTARLSMVKGQGSELAETNTFTSGVASPEALLRSAAVFGPNGSGKTNLVDALHTMQEIILHSAKDVQQDEPLLITPFLLDKSSRSKPSEFEVTFIRDGIRYQYGFAATAERVTEEWLLAFPKGRPQRWIDRKYDKKIQSDVWGAMAKLEGSKSEKALWERTTRGNALFLSTAIQLNNKQLRPVYEWFSQTLAVIGPGGRLPTACSEFFCEQSESRKAVLSFLRTADIDVDDIVVEKEEEKDEDVSLKASKRKRKLKWFRMNMYFLYRLQDGSMQSLEWGSESDGTRELFAYAASVIETLRNGSVLVVDELHNHLHPQLVRFLVELFHSLEVDTQNPQLVFTTHDTSVLDQQLLRRDQVWFCERKERSTQLLRLTDYSPRKGEENFRRRYLSGRYGALPYVKSMGELHDILDAGW